VTPDKAALAATFIGVDATIASVLTVYQLFALQSWVDRCRAAETRARNVAESTASGSLARVRAKVDCERALDDYPYWQMAGIVLMLATLTILGVAVVREVPHWARAYALVPLCLLTTVVMLSTIATKVRTCRGVRDAIRLCESGVVPRADPAGRV
jgi:hypothetical protein